MTTESLRKFSVQIGPWRRDPSIHPSRYDLWTWQGLQRDRRKTSKQLGLGVCTEITIKRLAEKNVRCLTQTDNRCRDFCRNIFFNKLSSDFQRRLAPPFFLLIPYDVPLFCCQSIVVLVNIHLIYLFMPTLMNGIHYFINPLIECQCPHGRKSSSYRATLSNVSAVYMWLWLLLLMSHACKTEYR